MPDPVTATIAGVTGATSIYGASKASSSAKSASKSQAAAEAAALEFQQQQYPHSLHNH